MNLKTLTVVGMAASALATQGMERPRELFNGKDLTGWYTFLKGRGRNNDPKGVVRVSDGILRISGEEWGAVVTEEEFSDYRLDVEYRFTGTCFGDKAKKALDSGILFHSTGPDGAFYDTWLYSHEYNLITGASGDIWTVGDEKTRPDMVVVGETGGMFTDVTMPEGPYRRHAIWKEGGEKIELRGNRRLCRCDISPDWTDTPAAPYAANERPTGEWNTATLICRGAAVECWFNGRLVNKATRVEPHRGKIQLQSEGCGVEFRRVTLRSLGALYGDLPDASHAWSVHDWIRPKPTKVTPSAACGGAPSDAVVLFDGTKASLDANWCDEKGNASKWRYSDEGYFYTVPNWKNGGSIQTRAHFGDCQLHIEYRHDPANLFADRGPQMRGNSGVFLMGTAMGYEVQVLDSFLTSRELDGKPGFVDNYADGQAGSVYAENPPLVNPARPAGEWQIYDIVFHQPVWDGDTLVHPGSMTVFFNGVLVQDHWEMEGLTTHCHRRPLAPHPTTGPLALQDHGCIVQFRNVWYRPLASRWANVTHAKMSGRREDVMAQRRATAARLYAQIADPKSVTALNLKDLAEAVSYANEGDWGRDFAAVLSAYRARPGVAAEVKSVNEALDALVRGGVIPAAALLPVGK